MKCATVQKMLTAFLDGEVPEKKRCSIREHLAGCDECQRHLRQMEKVLHWAGTWKERAVSPGFVTRLKARIAAGEAAARGTGLLWFPRAQQALAVAAAACLIFLGGYFAAVIFSGGKEAATGEQRGAVPPSGKGVETLAWSGEESERLIVGVQRIKMVFGNRLNERAYEQLNEIQRVLAARAGSARDDLAVVEELQRGEALVKQGQYAEARDLLDGIAEGHSDHPLRPYVQMTKMLAAPEQDIGSTFLRNAYAALVQETVGDPKQLYDELTNYPGQMAAMREYGWNKIVESADRLNPLNALSFLERQILGVEDHGERETPGAGADSGHAI
jgi:hypothetical protein